MKKRIFYLLALFGIIMVVFILQKPVFMSYIDTFSKNCSLSDYLNVMIKGTKLDAATAAYFVVFPWLLLLVGIWFCKINLRKIMLAYFVFITLFMSLAFLADMTLYDFWNFKLDTTVLYYIDSPSNAAAGVSFWFLAVRMISALLLSAFLFWIFMKITPTSLSPLRLMNKLWGTLFFLLIGGFLFLVIRGGVTKSTNNIGCVYFSENQFLNHSAVNPIFSFIYSLGKSENFSEQFNFFPEEERKEFFEGLYPKGGEPVTRILKTDRPNVLIILLESFGGNFVEALGGEPGITPHLNRLSEEGIFFTQSYSNSFRTDRAVVCTFSGYLGLPTTSVMKLPLKSQTLPSIASHLADSGYRTDFLYGGDINFTNMKSYLYNTGYQRLIHDKHFTSKEQKTHAWGVSDDITFNYLYNLIQERDDSPWHIGYLTLSSHDPFIVPYHRLENKLTNAMAFTDDCLGQFIDRLKETPAWDNLLVICLADHGYSYPKHIRNHDPAFFHTPMLWLGGAITGPMKIDKIVNQADLAATLLGQLNLPHDDFDFSRDVFSSAYTYPFAFFAYNNGFGFMDSTGVSVYDNNSERIILDMPFPDAERVKKGKAILQTVYDDLGKR